MHCVTEAHGAIPEDEAVAEVRNANPLLLPTRKHESSPPLTEAMLPSMLQFLTGNEHTSLQCNTAVRADSGSHQTGTQKSPEFPHSLNILSLWFFYKHEMKTLCPFQGG